MSRKVNQLNFPTDALVTAREIESEIVLLKESDGRVRYAGWYRRLASAGRALYTGFYMTQQVPHFENPCVKVVFPMPNGNATVELDEERLRVWRVKSLHEEFFVYLDSSQTLRCDHSLSFLGRRVLQLHYRIERVPVSVLPT